MSDSWLLAANEHSHQKTEYLKFIENKFQDLFLEIKNHSLSQCNAREIDVR